MAWIAARVQNWPSDPCGSHHFDASQVLQFHHTYLEPNYPFSEAIKSLALNDSVLHPLERKLLSRDIYTIDLIIPPRSQISLYRTHSALPAALPTQAYPRDNGIDNEIRKPSAESPHVMLRRLVRRMVDVSWLEPVPVHCKSGLLTGCANMAI